MTWLPSGKKLLLTYKSTMRACTTREAYTRSFSFIPDAWHDIDMCE